MITDKPPRKSEYKDEYARSEEMTTLGLPAAEPLRDLANQLEQAMRGEHKKEIAAICNSIAKRVCEEYGVAPPTVKVLGCRPLEENGDQVDELYGDYRFEDARIRLWMRTAILEKMTSYGTLLSTLCHEICHHLDYVHFGFPNTFHTRGFYERAGLLYHHVRGTPKRTLVWDRQKDGTLRINWPKTMRGRALSVSIIALLLGSVTGCSTKGEPCCASYPIRSFEAHYESKAGSAPATTETWYSDGQGKVLLVTDTKPPTKKLIDYKNETQSVLDPKKGPTPSTKLETPWVSNGTMDETSATALGDKTIDGHPCKGWKIANNDDQSEWWLGDDTGCYVMVTSKKAGHDEVVLKLVSYKPESNLKLDTIN